MGLFRKKTGEVLVGEERNLLAWGGLYAMQQRASLTTFSTGLGVLPTKGKILYRCHGIRDRVDALLWLGGLTKCVEDTLHRMQNEMHEPVVHRNEKAEKLLLQYHIVEERKDISKISSLGWEIGRLSFLPRVAADAGYITESEAWMFMREADRMGKSFPFKDWKEFTKSYLIGRTMAGHEKDHFIPVFCRYQEELLKPGNLWNL